MALSDALPIPKKNTAYRATFALRDAYGDLLSAAAGLDSEVSKDGGAFADCTNEVTEIGTSGIYYLDLAAGEMNADTVAVRVLSSSTGYKTVVLVLYPAEASDLMQGAVWDELEANHQTASSFGAFFKRLRQWVSNSKLIVESSGQKTVYDDDAATPKYQIDLSAPAAGQVKATVTAL